MDATQVSIGLGALGTLAGILVPLLLNWSKHRAEQRHTERQQLIATYELVIENLRQEIARVQAEREKERQSCDQHKSVQDELIERLKQRLTEKDAIIERLTQCAGDGTAQASGE